VSGTPRVLAIMGSGETAPTMAKVHRALFDRFGSRAVPAAILDTPYGFQENADELSARTEEFFATSVGNPVEVASFRSADVDAITAATAVARLREARYVMAGPGSPSYALRQWTGSGIPEALAEKLAGGGIVTLASAAALTLGVVTIPVYEIYKAGDDPSWLDGLDLLGSATGLHAAVVPHYDNAEGGTHDTRFCYMGERRLRVLEGMLPAGVFVLGVDSHTALILDLETGEASVSGLGGVTVRVDGRSTRFAAGSGLTIEAIGEAARSLAAGDTTEAVHDAALAGNSGTAPATPPVPAIRDAMADVEGTFVAALERGDTREAVAALLDLEAAIAARLRGGEDSPDLDAAGSMFRSLIVRLGEGAADRPSRDLVDGLVDGLVEARDVARLNRDFATADRIRDRLAAAGVEVRDSPEGSTWVLGGTSSEPVPTGPGPGGGASGI
jgi:hypothetical protein